MPPDRELLRATFDAAAARYQRARPDYPADLFGELVRLAGLSPGDRLLEIGCATGKATLRLARAGLRIVCLEIGQNLVTAARRELSVYPGVEVVRQAFEDWRPDGGGSGYDLVFAATSWHWIDPAIRYQRAWQALRPGGHLAFWSATHVVPADGDPFFAEIQDVYDEIGEALPPGTRFLRPGELPDSVAEIQDSGLFDQVAVRQFDWEVRYDADGYIGLLDTFSGHLAMAPWQRDRLYGEIRRRLALRPDGQLRRHGGAALHVARRRAGAAGADRPARQTPR